MRLPSSGQSKNLGTIRVLSGSYVHILFFKKVASPSPGYLGAHDTWVLAHIPDIVVSFILLILKYDIYKSVNKDELKRLDFNYNSRNTEDGDLYSLVSSFHTPTNVYDE